MQKQPVIDRSITSQNGLCAKIKTQDPCYLFYFLSLKTHKLKISCQLENLCKEQSNYLSNNVRP